MLAMGDVIRGDAGLADGVGGARQAPSDQGCDLQPRLDRVSEQPVRARKRHPVDTEDARGLDGLAEVLACGCVVRRCVYYWPVLAVLGVGAGLVGLVFLHAAR